MKRIDIKIPDNLTPIEEAKLIAKKLVQKALTSSGTTKEVQRIGTQLDVIELQTQINITRFSNEPVIQMVTCNVCGCEYQNNTAVYYWNNYGGKQRKNAVCSEQCQNDVIEFLGDRAAKTKSKLKAIRLY